jgi:ubiquinone/menaquinone biosynthesis C-methylase UbiE
MSAMGNRRRQSLEQITHRYDRLARFYNVLEPLYLIHDGARRKAVQALELSRGDTVLEIGCGTGRNLAHLANAVGESGSVIGVDAPPGCSPRHTSSSSSTAGPTSGCCKETQRG